MRTGVISTQVMHVRDIGGINVQSIPWLYKMTLLAYYLKILEAFRSSLVS